MKIKEIFKKDISRNINPAVVVGAKAPEVIKAEIEEYVFTDSLIEHMYKFFNTVFNGKDKKTGVWVNGYYGSGKSHFIKYINYCIDRETSENAFGHFQEEVKDYDNISSDVSNSNIELIKKKVARSNSDTIMFNIEAVAGDKGDLKKRFTRIFLNQFNRFRGYNAINLELALYVEKQLDEEGVYGEFKEKIRTAFHKNWDEDGPAMLAFKKTEVFNLIKELIPGIDLEYLDKKLKNPDEITIEDTLIPELKEYLKDKPESYRLIFLIDEISQYIGGNIDLLLNLQTIVEKVSDNCDNKVWIVCTAQQKLEEIVDETKSMNKGTSEEAVGKILGRFETRIPLTSDEADYITKIRVLDKNSTGIEALDSIYNTNKDAIENQFDFQHSFYKGFVDEADFRMSYPFIPYQFRLISDIFESFSQKGYVIKEVKDNERSVLGITHFTVKKNSEMEIGRFIPFDAFFNDLLEANLTHIATRIIERALKDDSIRNNSFAKRVVKILFMVSSLIESKAISFPSNRDNIASLLIENTDENRLNLQEKTQAVLEKLVKVNIIRVDENGAYHFFKDDEIEVATLIQNTHPTEEDRIIFMNNILQKILKVQNKFRYENKDFKISYWVDEKKIYPTGDIIVKILVFDTRSVADIAVNNINKELIICFNNGFMKDGDLRSDFSNACKTDKYLKLNSATASKDRQKTHEIFRARNSSIIDSMEKKIASIFPETPFISEKQIIEFGKTSGTTPTKKYESILHKHISRIYKYNLLQNDYAKNTEDLRKASAARANNTILSNAEQYIEDKISQFNDSLSISDIIKSFEPAPFGWKDLSVIHMILELVKKRKREIHYNNYKLDDLRSFVEKAIKSNEQTSLIIKSQAECSVELKDKAVESFQDIFNCHLRSINDCYKVEKEMRKIISDNFKEYESFSREYGDYPFAKHFIELSKLLSELSEERDINIFFTNVGNSREFVSLLSDECMQLQEFVSDKLSTYNEIRNFVKNNSINFDDLAEADKDKAKKLKDFVENDDRPFNGFHVQLAVYKELKISLSDLVEKLKKEAVKEYENIYAELKVEADKIAKKEVNIDPVYSLNDKLIEIGNKTRIIELKNLKLESSFFKGQKLKEIIDLFTPTDGDVKDIEKAKIKIKTQIINNEEEMESFLDRTREKIKKELDAEKIVIIE